MQDAPMCGHTVRLAADLDLLDAVRERFCVFLRGVGISKEAYDQWTLVFTEALANAIVHGSQGDARKWVDVSWSTRGDELCLEVADSGSGPSQEQVDAKSLPQDPYEAHGRGLFIIQELCDTVEHWRSRLGYRMCAKKKHPGLLACQEQDPVFQQALEEITLCYESLAAFYRLGDSLIESKEVSEFLSQAMPDLMRLVHADRAFLFAEKNLESVLYQDLEVLDFFCGRVPNAGKTTQVAQSGMEWVWENKEEASGDHGYAPYTCGLCYPVKAKGHVLAVVTLVRSESEAHFNAAELSTIRTFGDLFGIAMAHADNLIARERDQRAVQEIKIAAELQDALFPVPTLQGDDVGRFFARRVSAREVGGDYVDACKTVSGDLIFLMADVMGKGVPAAFFAAMLRTALHINVNKSASLTELMGFLNQVLCSQVRDLSYFATCALARITKDRRHLEIVNAGHCPVLVLQGGDIKSVQPSAPPLGLFVDAKYALEPFNLDSSMGLLMVTDGLFEWEKDGSIWGWDAFIKSITPQSFLDPDGLWRSLDALMAGHVEMPPDDQTMLCWTLT
ncbi:MAG TPA: hypothetical protein DIU37_04560 [Opitutae bacterium]|nr:hypothetical protein [Opitutae bacterium]